MTSRHLTVKTVLIALFIGFTSICGKAAGEEHISIQASYSDSSGGRVASADFYQQNKQIIAVSTLFPELAVKLSEQNQIIFRTVPVILSFLHPEKIDAMIKKTDNILSEWMKEHPETVSDGVFAGDIFQHAGNVCSYETSLDELLAYIQDIIENSKEPVVLSPEDNEIYLLFYDMFDKASSGLNLSICISKYDEGSFYHISIKENDEIIYTVSFDKSKEKQINAVFGCRTGGRYYYRNLKYQYDKNTICIYSELYSGKETSYRAVSKHTALLKESVSLTAAEDDTVAVQGKIESWKLPIPIAFSGNCQVKKGYAELDIRVFAESTYDQQIHINTCFERQIRPVSFPDKKIVDVRNEKEKDELSLSTYSGLSAIVAEIIPRLPVDYQKILINMLTN